MPSSDLVVALRAYPGLSKSPAFFHDKHTMWEASVRSLAQALDGTRSKVHVILDNCPDRYAETARAHLPGDGLEIHRLPPSGNRATWTMQLDILSALPSGTPVYLAEDDYLYLPGAFAESLAFAETHRDVDFISLFDHPGWYGAPDELPVDLHPIRWHGKRHWRTAVCTTCSFQTRSDILARTRPALDTFAKGAYDMSMWMMLTRHFLTSPRFLARVAREPLMRRIWLSAWRHGWKVIPRIPRASLWAPMPSLATHLEAVDLAHGIDWEPVALPS